jgi:hypothetical protein
VSVPPGSWALVTGASAGIGLAFARALAARGHPVLLIARREARLRELAAHLHAHHGVATAVVAADLASPDGLAACRAAADDLPGPLGLAVLNAGFGARGPVAGQDRARLAAMVRVNCEAVVDLGAHVLPGMVRRGAGALVVVSSAAAAQPVPYMSTYAATKAFELAWVRGVADELRGTGVRALAVCPGPVETEFHEVAWGGAHPYARWPVERPDRTVARALRALERGRTVVATGPVARLTMPLVRLAPVPLVTRVAGILHRPRRAGGVEGARGAAVESSGGAAPSARGPWDGA